jgi:hypothetical protein
VKPSSSMAGHQMETTDLTVGGTIEFATGVVQAVDAVGQPDFFPRPLHPEVFRFADDRPEDTSEAIECDHSSLDLMKRPPKCDRPPMDSTCIDD